MKNIDYIQYDIVYNTMLLQWIIGVTLLLYSLFVTLIGRHFIQEAGIMITLSLLLIITAKDVDDFIRKNYRRNDDRWKEYIRR